jgi:hypothetical protein
LIGPTDTFAIATPAGRAGPASVATPRMPRFHGIVPPLVTPLHDADTLDIEGLERLVEHVVRGGVHGLFVLGTTGEGPAIFSVSSL